jgi:hypothetical protein
MQTWNYLAEVAQNTALGCLLGYLARPWLDGRVQAGTRWLAGQRIDREDTPR